MIIQILLLPKDMLLGIKSLQPLSSASKSKSFLTANSPCGFALLKVLESVASPFRHKQDDNEADEDESVDVADTRIEEWQESHLNQDAMGIVDWSVKRKLRLECHPGSCLPTTVDWQDALSYWQHPAMYPLPTTLSENDASSQSTSQVSATLLSSSNNEVSEMVRGRNALLHRLARHDDTSLWKQQRNREWQEAFVSLYRKWMNQVQELVHAWQQGEQDASVILEMIKQTYFYAMASGQTVLFRVGVEHQQEEATTPTIVPMVVLSSTTQHLRSKLETMGIKLLYYNDKRPFDAAILERKRPPKQVHQQDMEAVHEELEALRRAQAHGETAGADVSISTKAKTTSTGISPRSIPPLCIQGHDDVDAFFEFYLNTLGSNTTWLKGNGHVPLLLSRKVGPFMHASMQSVPVTSRREATPAFQQQQQAEDHHAAIEVRGPILPCALQELVCAAASRMMKDTTTGVAKHSSSNDDEDDDVGSHYFVIQTQAHDGEERLNLDSTTTGTASSSWFNDGGICNALSGDEDAPNECEHGEVMSMLVWDIARPNMVVYKSEPNVG